MRAAESLLLTLTATLTIAGASRGRTSAYAPAIAAPRPALLQQQVEDPLPGGEGPLQSSTFLPVAEALRDEIAAGDEALFTARELAANGRGDLAALELAKAFEAWHGALEKSKPGDAVPLALPILTATASSAGPGSPPRATQSVPEAVLVRLEAAAERERAAWNERFGPVAEVMLTAAGPDADKLAQIERLHPGTAGAARAALLRADLAFESGALHDVRTWLERARRHGVVSRIEFANALATRIEFLWDLGRGPSPDGSPTWATARALEPAGHLALVPRGPVSGSSPRTPAPGRDVQPGLTFLEDGRVAVQTAREVHVVDPAAPQRESIFDPFELLAPLPRPAAPWSGRTAPGWPHLPTAQGQDLVLVVGRTRWGGAGNAILCVQPPAPGSTTAPAAVALPQRRWALSPAGLVDAGGNLRKPPELAELGEWEAQPGPVVAGDRVYVQVWTWTGEVSAWLLALDLRTGHPLWKRFLAKGSELSGDPGRFGRADPPGAAAQPLRLLDAPEPLRVFAGTHLGAGALVDGVDGRLLWTFRNRRRDPRDDGWTGAAPPLAPAPSPDDPPVLVWGPADSDRLYWLPAGPVRPGAAGLGLAPTRAVGEAIALVAGDPEGALVLSRAGPERAPSIWNAESGARRDALYLARDEELAGEGLASAQRMLFATDKALYLLDRTRDLYLLDCEPLQRSTVPAGGSVHARGATVLVLGGRDLWIFRAR